VTIPCLRQIVYEDVALDVTRGGGVPVTIKLARQSKRKVKKCIEI
jgi:hypothetical protein